MALSARKGRLVQYILTSLPHDQYAAHALECAILSLVDARHLAQPTFAVDHLRRAMVDYGLMRKDPYTEVYTIIEPMHRLDVLHGQIVAGLETKSADDPQQLLLCRFCDKQAKPAAMLNHYFKKHDLADVFERARAEFGPKYHI